MKIWTHIPGYVIWASSLAHSAIFSYNSKAYKVNSATNADWNKCIVYLVCINWFLNVMFKDIKWISFLQDFSLAFGRREVWQALLCPDMVPLKREDMVKASEVSPWRPPDETNTMGCSGLTHLALHVAITTLEVTSCTHSSAVNTENIWLYGGF